MKRAFALAAFTTLSASVAGAAPDPAPIAIKAARLLDVRSGRYVERPVVVVRGGSIEAIRSATTVAAELLGLAGKAGVIEPGAFADLVAVPGDPLKDVRVLSRIDFVMKAGEVVRSIPPVS